jgi:hypothetical protein
MSTVKPSTRTAAVCSTVAAIARWRFVLNNQATRRSVFDSVTVAYGPPPKRFGRVRGHRAPFLADRQLPRPPRMTLAAAVRRLRRAGYRHGFYAVTLRKPLSQRKTHPLYIFSLGKRTARFVAVDTVTGRRAFRGHGGSGRDGL